MEYGNKKRVCEIINLIEWEEKQLEELQKAVGVHPENEISINLSDSCSGRAIINITLDDGQRKAVLDMIMQDTKNKIAELEEELKTL